MADVLLIHRPAHSGLFNGDPIEIPSDIAPGFMTVTVNANKNDANVFNIVISIFVSSDGGQTWIEKCRIESYRDLDDAGTPIGFMSVFRVEDFAGKLVRPHIESGQSTVFVSAVFTED